MNAYTSFTHSFLHKNHPQSVHSPVNLELQSNFSASDALNKSPSIMCPPRAGSKEIPLLLLVLLPCPLLLGRDSACAGSCPTPGEVLIPAGGFYIQTVLFSSSLLWEEMLHKIQHKLNSCVVEGELGLSLFFYSNLGAQDMCGQWVWTQRKHIYTVQRVIIQLRK